MITSFFQILGQTIWDILRAMFVSEQPAPIKYVPPAPVQTVTPAVSEPSRYLLEDFCTAIATYEGAFQEGTIPNRLNNPGDLRWGAGAPYPYHATGVSKGNFLIFPDYHTGFMALTTMIKNACLGNSKIYHPSMCFYDFFAVYAPAKDNNDCKAYAEWVAARLGVNPQTYQIKQLLG